MSDPKRWRDDASVPPDVRDLLDAHEDAPEMSSADRQRIGQYVTGVAAGTIATTTLLSAKVVAAAVAVTVGGVVTFAAVQHTMKAPREETAEEAVAPAQVSRGQAPALRRVGGATSTRVSPEQSVNEHLGSEPPPSVPHESGVPLGELPSDEVPSEPSGHDTRVGRSAASPSAVGSREAGRDSDGADAEPAIDSLAQEAAMLERARAVLVSDPATALAEAERHRTLHEDGQLAAERELIAVDALRRLGRTSVARQRAEALLARNPNGMYARRARRLMDLVGEIRSVERLPSQ